MARKGRRSRFGRKARFAGLGFSGSLLTGKLPRSGPIGIVSTGINLGLAYFSGILFGNGVQAIAAATPIIGQRQPVPQIIGALAAFSSGGFVGLAGYVIASGLLGGVGFGSSPIQAGA